MAYKVKDLLNKLNEMISRQVITPESEITIGHYTTGKDGLKGDLNYWGLDWIFKSSEDDDKPNWEREKVLEILAYDEEI